MRIVIITSYEAAAEPRAPRHAVAACIAFPRAEVTFIDMAPLALQRRPDPPILNGFSIKRLTLSIPTRACGVTKLALRRAKARFGRLWLETTGQLNEWAFGERVHGVSRLLRALSPDLIVAHNIELLHPVMAACASRTSVVFDCMEYYSDMGDSQSPAAARAARVAETRWLNHCTLVIASSDELADQLVREYHIRRPLASYNVPPVQAKLPPRRGGGLNLYWRNNVIGLGQRGLDDILIALTYLPKDVMLFLQGHPSTNRGNDPLLRAAQLGVADRVRVLPPYSPGDAVRQAAVHDVGLCLERQGPRNHDLTVSNKMFDYHMAGLAVVASNLPSLRAVINKSAGGLLYAPGEPGSLATCIRALHADRDLLSRFQSSARTFALSVGNLDRELETLSLAMRRAFAPR